MEHLLNQTITVAAATGKNRYGEPTYGTAVTVKARFSLTNKTIIMPRGETEPIDAVVDVMGDIMVAAGDKVTYKTINYKVMRAKEAIGGGGSVHHRVLLVQRWQM